MSGPGTNKEVADNGLEDQHRMAASGDWQSFTSSSRANSTSRPSEEAKSRRKRCGDNEGADVDLSMGATAAEDKKRLP